MGIGTFSRVARFANRRAEAPTVRLLVPPYQAFSPFATFADRDLPLGALAVASGRDVLALLGTLTLLEQRWPWIVPVMIPSASDAGLREAVELVSELRHRVVVIVDGPGCEARAAAAARQRAFPASQELASFTARRLGDPGLAELLADQFSVALGGSVGVVPSSATLSRAFSRLGPYTARDWRSLAVLIRELCARASGQPALGGQVTTRTVDANARRFLGASAHQAAACLGWEWMLEQALRSGGYRMRSVATV